MKNNHLLKNRIRILPVLLVLSMIFATLFNMPSLKVSATPSTIIIDNGDTGYSVTSQTVWTRYTGLGYQNDVDLSGIGTGDYAMWRPTLTETYDYNVYVRWTAGSGMATNATYYVYNTSTYYPVFVNQNYNGDTWYLLGTYNLPAGTGSYVFLNNICNGYVSADAVKFEPAASTEQWKTKELTFTAANSHTNPYADIVADVQFTNGPKTITRPMFWDGGNTWRVRFAPPSEGTWSWSIVNANSTAAADAGITGSAAGGTVRSFTCIAPSGSETRNLYTKGFVNVANDPNNPSADGTYMSYADGTPFFWESFIVPNENSYATDFWHNDDPSKDPNVGQFQLCIDKAASNNYNVIKFLFLDWCSTFQTTTGGGYNATFPGTSPTRMNSMSQDAINTMRLEVDSRMDYMASKDMMIELESCYAEHIFYDANSDGTCEDYTSAFQNWYRYLYGRYGAYPISLDCGYEIPWYYDGGYTNGVSNRTIRLNNYNTLFNYCDSMISSNIPLTGLFSGGSPISHDYDSGDVNNNYCMSLVDNNAYKIVTPMQNVCFSNVYNPTKGNNHTLDFYEVFRQYYARIETNRTTISGFKVKPIISNETGWEGANNPEYVLNPTTDATSLAFMSLNMWKSAMVGAGTSYASYNSFGQTWYNQLYSFTGQVVGSRISDLFNNPELPWWRMAPDIDAIAKGYVSWTNPNIATQPWQMPDIRTDGKLDFPDANQLNTNYLIYFPSYTKGTFDATSEGTLCQVKQAPGAVYSAQWYNPTQGGYTATSSITATNGGIYGTCLTLPSKPDNNDWVLWLKLTNAGSSYYLLPRISATGSSTVNSSWLASKAVDNAKGNDNAWSSTGQSQTGNQSISIDSGNNYYINKITVIPRTSGGNVYCFPVDFKFQYSTSGANWVDIPGQSYTNYTKPANNNGETFTLSTPVFARHIRMVGTKFATDGYNYYMQICEIYLYSSHDTPAYSAIARTSASASTTVNSSWLASKAIDNDTSDSNAWSSASTGLTGNENITIDFGYNNVISQLVVVPRTYNNAVICFPVDFKFQYSTNGSTWTDISGQSYTNYSAPTNNNGQVFTLSTAITARYIRMVGTKFSSYSGTYYMQISEIYANRNNAIASHTLRPRVSASSSSSVNSSWPAFYAIDNNTDSNNAWSSQNHTINTGNEWFSIDMGSSTTVGVINMIPRTDNGSVTSFPVDFKFQYSTNGTTWTDISGQSYTNYSTPSNNNGQVFTFGSAVTARYIRIVITKFSANGNYYYAQIGEVYLYS